MAKIGYRFISFSVVIALGFLGEYTWAMGKETHKNISTDKFVEMLNQKDFTLINVHIPYQGEIAQTDLLIPFNKIDRYKNQLPADKNAKLVVYCMMGPMGRIAAEKLTSMGYRQVIHLQGGMVAWQMAGKKLLFRSD